MCYNKEAIEINGKGLCNLQSWGTTVWPHSSIWFFNDLNQVWILIMHGQNSWLFIVLQRTKDTNTLKNFEEKYILIEMIDT